MIDPNCCFLYAGRCTILTRTRCMGCKFRKSSLEYMIDREHATRILERKGLESYRSGDIITTRERDEDS